MDAELRSDRAALADTVRRFAESEIAPHVQAWDDAGEFPRTLYARAAELGLLGLGYPEELGGTPASYSLKLPAWIALARHGRSGGVLASLFSHNIGLPPVVLHASDAVRREVVPPVLRGEKIAALAITEPGGGSDVAALRTTARRDGDHYVVNGEKTFITSGMRADWITVALRTGEGRGAGGISMLLVPGDAPGLTRTRLSKMGWLCSDTATLHFDNVRVPARYLLGDEGAGFRMIMGNFNGERIGLAAGALGFSQACLDEALAWARDRKTFGAALIEHQAVRHKLVDMQMRIASTEAWIEAVSAEGDALEAAGRFNAPEWVAQICMLKNHATQTMQFCADQAVQILGGMGFMRGTVSERIYREVKVMMIGGGAEEIMKELAARQMGW
ncbi:MULTISPECIES: acyl-CoA dehydrogenase family protein [unclassified Variovorax]|jgi:acyl-CoA dehydrogenase|uniref:acyl-CoA dehydrogenase family protein n=1 Tax=unclassified Variovorax TaxID=663243 RepID=UPI000F7E8270|nr:MULTISPECIES: acyl-CoA dehydrogenase family protein [unclassified Variovorax]RSZ42414.1 acyl-CoA dehydrogenase [Variovorax sp. 553]RSZ43388.1 acyl-CoA dehydrogenase [Variovorax sp. 679]